MTQPEKDSKASQSATYQPTEQHPAAEYKLDFKKMDGLIPAIVQDQSTHTILMVGFMNEAAWAKTLSTGMVTFFSRTRNTLWTKGETSGNFLRVRRIFTDCDDDTVVIEATPHGPTCHTGADSCFFKEIITPVPAPEEAKG